MIRDGGTLDVVISHTVADILILFSCVFLVNLRISFI